LNLQPGTAPTGNGPVRTYRIPGAQGTVGFISPLGEHFYETCNRLRLTADGKLRACLFKTGELDLRPALNESQPLEPHIQECVRRPQTRRTRTLAQRYQCRIQPCAEN